MNHNQSKNGDHSSKSLCQNLKVGLAVLAFGEGLLASHRLAFYFIYVEHFNIDLLSYSVFETIIGMLFYLNPIIGYFSDRFALFGSKKKSYLILAGLITVLSYGLCLVGSLSHAPVVWIFVLNFIIEVMHACRAVVIDSFCVIVHNIQQMTPKEDSSSSTSSVSTLFCCRLVGKILSTILIAVFYRYMGIYCRLIRHVGDGWRGSSRNHRDLLHQRTEAVRLLN
jgi:MFS family permease